MRESIITKDLRCYLADSQCRGRIEIHHCLHGSYRAFADREGLVVPLCSHHHQRLHDNGEHDEDLEQVAQLAWMSRHNATVDEFREACGKSWL